MSSPRSSGSSAAAAAKTPGRVGFGLWRAGSSAGLMAVLVAVGMMSLPWMGVITVLACA